MAEGQVRDLLGKTTEGGEMDWVDGRKAICGCWNDGSTVIHVYFRDGKVIDKGLQKNKKGYWP
jgi:hypothetical protein